MIKMILTDHGIKDIYFSENIMFEETSAGKWLKDNNIDYRISAIAGIIHIDLNNNLNKMIGIENIYFFNEEDFTAFKLRWC